MLLIYLTLTHPFDSSFTGHNAPLYPRPEDNIDEEHPGYFFNVYNSIKHWIDKGKSVTLKCQLSMHQMWANPGLFCSFRIQ